MQQILVRLSLAATLALVATAAPDSAAQTLYKLIDKNGKVTYVETPPKDFDGKVIRLDIDPKANTATLPKAPSREEVDARRSASKAGEDTVVAARQRLEAARKALAAARDNPGEGDVVRIGKVGGGARPAPSEGYQQRLEKLEGDVKDAEEDLQKAERGR